MVNYRYFVSGGPERYMFNVIDALTARGHEVIPFSIHYARNRSTPYARYFVEPLGTSVAHIANRDWHASAGHVRHVRRRLSHYRSETSTAYSKNVDGN